MKFGFLFIISRLRESALSAGNWLATETPKTGNRIILINRSSAESALSGGILKGARMRNKEIAIALKAKGLEKFLAFLLIIYLVS
ncbi:hypothetical protein [Pedobacter sp. Leaf176]|uniref:hypothetical protein n=1 Tax=Pedobacter sp. Leaf176 TaxID=1736286 RepID=UPI0006F50588|nr:hypothetical protein [Pedobacter sp. Leaf176]KQR72430.1 hypothetical protein ASF92_03860 [Pedobacter sp. Leaf176]